MNNQNNLIKSARETVDSYRKKDLNNPEFAAQLSESLNDLSNYLGEVERWGEALLATKEALVIDRKLAFENADYFFNFTTSVENHWNNFRKLKQFNEALSLSKNGVEDLKILKSKNMDVYDWSEARMLHLYSESLWDTGSRKESYDVAEQEIRIYRSRTNNHKKSSLLSEYYLDLARAIESLANKLVEDNQFEDSFDAYAESIQIYKNLTKIQSNQNILWEHSRTLKNYGFLLKKTDRQKELLATLKDEIEINRNLCKEEKSIFSGLTIKEIQEVKALLENDNIENLNGYDLINEKQKVLRRAEETLWKSGHKDAALKLMLARINIFKNKYPIDNSPYLEEIAYGLNNYCLRLLKVEKHKEALEACNESIVIKNKLAKQNPEKYSESLVNSLENQALILSKLGNHKESIETMKDALEISQNNFSHKYSEYSDKYFADCLNSYSCRLKEANLKEEAIRVSAEEIKIRRIIAKTKKDNASRVNELANSLTNYGNYLSELNRTSDAIEATLEGINIQREITSKKPSEYYYSSLLNNLKKYKALLVLTGLAEKVTEIDQEIIEVEKKHKQLEAKLASIPKFLYLKNLEASLIRYLSELRDAGEYEELGIISKELINLRLEIESCTPSSERNKKTFL